MKKLTLLLFICIISVQAQVGIGTTTPDNSSMLEIKSTDKGILIPRVYLTDITNTTTPINNPAEGLMIYNTNASVIGGVGGKGFYIFNGSNWEKIISSSNANFTDTDNQNLSFDTSTNTLSIEDGNSVTLPIKNIVNGNGTEVSTTGNNTSVNVRPSNGLRLYTGNVFGLGGNLNRSTQIKFNGNHLFFDFNSGLNDFRIGTSIYDYFKVSNNGQTFFGNSSSWTYNGSVKAKLDINNTGASLLLFKGNVQNHIIKGNYHTVFNNQKLALNFKIKSQHKDNMFLLDGFYDRIIIGGNTGNLPQSTLHIKGDITIDDSTATTGKVLTAIDATGKANWEIPKYVQNSTAGNGLIATNTGTVLNVVAQNGLTTNSDSVELGGTLLQNTQIDLDSNDFSVINGNTGFGTTTPTSKITIDNQSNPDNTTSLSINQLDNKSTDSYMINNYKESSGTGKAYGIYNKLDGSGTGKQIAISNNLYANNPTSHKGIENNFPDGIKGSKTGIINNFDASLGNNYGIKNNLQGATNSAVFGVENNLTGTGSGSKTAIKNYFSGANGNNIYLGINNYFNDTGNGQRYGIRNTFSNSNTGLGNKYGVYSTFDSNAGGTHYGIYNNVAINKGWAGYFIGKSYFSNKIGIGSGNDNPNSFIDIEATSTTNNGQLELSETLVNRGTRILFKNKTETNNKWTLYARADNTVSSNYFNIHNTASGNIVVVRGNGKVGIKRTPTTNTLEVNGTASKATPGSWLANSDKRLKKDIYKISPKFALDKVLKMKGVTYHWNDNKTGIERPTTIQYGFIAQDLKKLFPSKVTKDNLGFYQTSYGDYDPIFVEAIKALNNKIETLEKENKKLKKQLLKLKTLEEKLKDLELRIGN